MFLGDKSIDAQADFLIKRLEEYEKGISKKSDCGCLIGDDGDDDDCNNCLLHDHEKDLECADIFYYRCEGYDPEEARHVLADGIHIDYRTSYAKKLIKAWKNEMLRRININLKHHKKDYSIVICKKCKIGTKYCKH